MIELFVLITIGHNPTVFGVYDNQEQAVNMYKEWRDKLDGLIISRRYLNKEF
jgi:hypothetical protein